MKISFFSVCAATERLNFEAQLALEAGKFAEADRLAYESMLQAARGLVHEQWLDVPNDPAVVVKEFKERFAGLFQPSLAAYLFRRHEGAPATTPKPRIGSLKKRNCSSKARTLAATNSNNKKPPSARRC